MWGSLYILNFRGNQKQQHQRFFYLFFKNQQTPNLLVITHVLSFYKKKVNIRLQDKYAFYETCSLKEIIIWLNHKNNIATKWILKYLLQMCWIYNQAFNGKKAYIGIMGNFYKSNFKMWHEVSVIVSYRTCDTPQVLNLKIKWFLRLAPHYKFFLRFEWPYEIKWWINPDKNKKNLINWWSVIYYRRVEIIFYYYYLCCKYINIKHDLNMQYIFYR